MTFFRSALKEVFMKLSKLTLAAAIISAFSVPAFAGEAGAGSTSTTTFQPSDVVVQSNTSLNTNVSVNADMAISGQIYTDTVGQATTDNLQSSNITPGSTGTSDKTYGSSGSGAMATTTNTADVSDRAITDTSGAVNVNVAGGAANSQSSDAALAVVDTGQVFSSATSASTQYSSGTLETSSSNTATIDNAIYNIDGFTNANVAAGDNNQQSNQLAVSVNGGGGVAAISSAANYQTQEAAIMDAGSSNVATLGGASLSSVTGLANVNLASGAGNQQHNGLSIALTTTGGTSTPTGGYGK